MNCSFCGLDEEEVHFLFTPFTEDNPAVICDFCIDYAAELIAARKAERHRDQMLTEETHKDNWRERVGIPRVVQPDGTMK